MKENNELSFLKPARDKVIEANSILSDHLAIEYINDISYEYEKILEFYKKRDNKMMEFIYEMNAEDLVFGESE